ncbi:MAG: hypothetical protein JNM13_05600 [Hyphomicrobiaceae bacterium]|nr:hypothetical protein [Hyphomicrobiaceae bacterium]
MNQQTFRAPAAVGGSAIRKPSPSGGAMQAHPAHGSLSRSIVAAWRRFGRMPNPAPWHELIIAIPALA